MKNWAWLLVGMVLFSGCTPMTPTDGGNGNGGDEPMMPGDDDGSGDGGGDIVISGDFALQAILTPFDPDFEDFYGDKVSVFGDLAVVGTEFKNTLRGIADVYRRLGGEWIFLQRLEGGESRFPEQGVGSSVAINNAQVFVGAYKYAIPGSADIQTGAVYRYQTFGPDYNLEQTITPSDADDFEWFGSALVLDDNQSRLVVGAPRRSRDTGAAYVYTFNGNEYVLQQRLEPSDAMENSSFGESLASDGVTVVCGASGRDFGTGAVYVYELAGTQWNEVQMILAPDGDRSDNFGTSIGLEGDTLVIAADSKKRPQDDLLRAGAVYFYERVDGTWVLQQTVIPNDADAGLFGNSVAISDGRVAITLGGEQAVALYENVNGTWMETGRLSPDRTDFVLDSFGNALSYSGSTLMIGSRSSDAGGQRASGAAYIFDSDDGSGPDIPDGVRARLVP